MLTRRSNDHNFEDERHDDDGNLWPRSTDYSFEGESNDIDDVNLCPGGQVQVPPGEEQTPPCSHGGSQTTENKEEKMSKSLVKIYKSSHHHGIIWSGTNTISRASSSFQMEIRSAKH